MPSFNDLVDEVKVNLQGYTLRQDRITYVTNAGGLTTTSTQINVGSADNLAKGIIEIDDELIWIDNFTTSTNSLNVAPGFGRGYLGTTAAPHSQNAQVILSPTFPRSAIKKAINDTVRSLYPKLFAVGSTTFQFNAAQVTYPLPDDCREVLYMSWQTTGSSREWLPIRKWRFDPLANTPTFNTQKTINLYENIQPGRTVKVWYTMVPDTMDANTDDFVDVTGLPESCQDVIVYGACYRLLSFVDAGRINLSSAEADLNDTKIPASAGSAVSQLCFRSVPTASPRRGFETKRPVPNTYTSESIRKAKWESVDTQA
jgi:hypothetical protein